ncbi:MAG: hypothetical protein UU39_C0012G0006 [Candidatus Woesebacteria bacterium GW2011_GWD1_41_12]|uniref:Uncharacterized protein n=1 Tax=Candidatus Woesebacteria bacterium GW2011_GWD1_41_12 TaxID=1618593 RepID=A0A0G0UP38_9BACT|nr:MAG: hypothetical protein UU39_C0012G0006 [Candidatus Woesebacteria bacterium GW2011_GWD1_41_12]
MIFHLSIIRFISDHCQEINTQKCYNEQLWRKDDRSSVALCEGERKVQAAESRVSAAKRRRVLGVTLRLGQLEPQKLCRAHYPKGKGKRVKRGNPPRCNLRNGRLRSFPEPRGSRATRLSGLARSTCLRWMIIEKQNLAYYFPEYKIPPKGGFLVS